MIKRKRRPLEKHELIWFGKGVEAVLNSEAVPLSEEKAVFLRWVVLNYGYGGRVFTTIEKASQFSECGESIIKELLPILKDEDLIEKKKSRGTYYYCIII